MQINNIYPALIIWDLCYVLLIIFLYYPKIQISFYNILFYFIMQDKIQDIKIYILVNVIYIIIHIFIIH